MTVDEARERVTEAEASLRVYDEVLRLAETEGAPEHELRRLRAMRDLAVLDRDIARGELVFWEGMTSG